MSLMEWKDSFSVSVADIDKQHHKLVDMLNELHDAMQQGKGADALEQILNNMAEYTVVHFKDEEALMKKYGYPRYEEHKALHDAFVEKVAGFQEQLKQKKILLSLSVSSFLRDWLQEHILKVDMDYSQFFQDKGVK